ncbi:hypothetical protein [Halosimplex halophilum]|uniref:hypothetical protein n=1 Tax=Halosimplex halophilum TaxID=2559572 RepID=UPI00107F9847|nr:hypothetical protein [Halosimplex halophilum]
MENDPDIVVRNSSSVRSQAEHLGLESPESLVVLPRNYFSADDVDELKMNQEALTIEKLLEQEGVDPDELTESNERPVTHAWSAETIGPIIHFTAEFLVENWDSVLTVIGLIESYYSTQRHSSIKFKFSVEHPDGTCKQVEYEGEPDKLEQVLDKLEVERDELMESDPDEAEATDDKETESA